MILSAGGGEGPRRADNYAIGGDSVDFSIAEGVFTLRMPARPDTPVVVSVPHAGVDTHGFEAAL